MSDFYRLVLDYARKTGGDPLWATGAYEDAGWSAEYVDRFVAAYLRRGEISITPEQLRDGLTYFFYMGKYD
jgi:hypothetical protein